MPTTTAPRAAKIGDNNPPTTEQLMKEKHAAIFQRLAAWQKKAKKAKLTPETLEECIALDKLFAEGRDIANDADSVRKKEKEPHLRAGQEVDDVFNKGVRDEVGVAAGLAKQILQASANKKLAITRAEQAAAAAEEERLRRQADAAEEKARQKAEAGDTKNAAVLENRVEALDSAADQAGHIARQDVAVASKVSTGGLSSSVAAKMVCTGILNRNELDMPALLPFIKEDALIAAVNAYLGMGNKTMKGAVITEQAVGRVRGRA